MAEAPGIKKKMSGRDWNPKQLLAQPDEVRKMELGILFGVANDTTNATSDTGEVMEGLKGRFIFKKANGERVASYVLWLPGGMCGELFSLPREGKEIEFAFRVFVQRAENAAGYEWLFFPLVETVATDPLAALEAKISGGAAALTAPSEAPTQLPAPTESPAGAAQEPAKEPEKAPIDAKEPPLVHGEHKEPHKGNNKKSA